MNKEELMAKAKEAYELILVKAKNLIDDPSSITDLLDKAKNKLKSTELVDDLKEIPTLIEMISYYIKGEYKEVPVGSIVAIVGAVLYWVSPIDAIPDMVPVLGHVDDALVIALCLKSTMVDVNNFKKWKEINGK